MSRDMFGNDLTKADSFGTPREIEWEPQLVQLLDEVSVHGEGQWENTDGPEGWYAVSTAEAGGIIAYFQHESHAHFFRLALINATLNPIARQ